MKARLFAAIASVIFATANGQSPTSDFQSESVSGPQISIHVYNLSVISADTLDRALREVSRIFAHADANVHWELGDPEAEEAHSIDQSGPASFRDRHVRSYLVVRIGRGMARNIPSAALGVSLPNAQYGVSATIFQERVENLCRTNGRDFAVILGHAIAHELGHVVLASHGHAPVGIMRAAWGSADLDQAASGNPEKCRRRAIPPHTQSPILSFYSANSVHPLLLRVRGFVPMSAKVCAPMRYDRPDQCSRRKVTGRPWKTF